MNKIPNLNSISRKMGKKGFEPEASALFARMSPQPSSERKILMNNLIKGLKDAQLWNKFDCFYIYRSENEQHALLNWIKDAHNCTKYNDLPFIVDDGFKANGAGYLDTNYNPALDAVNYQLDSASLGVYYKEPLVYPDQEGIQGFRVRMWEVDQDRLGFQINQSNEVFFPSYPLYRRKGFWFFTRIASNAVRGYLNGGNKLNNASISSTIPSSNFLFFKMHFVPSNNQQELFGCIGGGFNSDDEVEKLTDLIYSFFTEIGEPLNIFDYEASTFHTDGTYLWVGENANITWNEEEHSMTITSIDDGQFTLRYDDLPAPLDTSKIYKFSFRAKSNNFTGPLSSFTSTTATTLSVVNPAVTPDYKYHEIIFQPIQTLFRHRVQADNGVAGTAITYDDLQLIEIGDA